MAYAYVGGNENMNLSGVSQASISTTYTPTAGNTLIILVTYDVTSTPTISGGGNTYNAGAGPYGDATGTGQINQVFYAQSVAGGSTSFLASFSPSSPYVGIRVEEYSGLGTYIGAVGQFQTSPGTGAGAVTSGNLNVSSAPAMFYGWGSNTDGNSTLSATAGWAANRDVFTANGTNWSITADELVSVTGNQAATFTSTNAFQHYATFAIAFQIAGGGPPGIPLLGQILM